MTTSSKQSAMFGTGLAVLIVGLLAAVGLWYAADQRQSDGVRNLARAPSGCDTTLDFEAVGEFTMYIETAGHFDVPIAGDCAVDGTYGVLGESLPAVSLEMTSPAGDDVVLANASGTTYDVDGFAGESIRTFSVETPGDHILRVDVAGDSDVRLVVAVGKDPSDGVGMMQLGAVLAALAGLVIAGAVMIASRRSPKPAPGGAVAAPWPTGIRQGCPQHRLAPKLGNLQWAHPAIRPEGRPLPPVRRRQRAGLRNPPRRLCRRMIVRMMPGGHRGRRRTTLLSSASSR